MVAPLFTSRLAQPSDGRLITDILQEGFATYRCWAPAGWEPPAFTPDALARLAGMLGRDDVWCLIAVNEAEPIGHIALAPVTREEPASAPAGTTYLWQLFVRPRWQGQGIATWLMDAALVEADRRGFRQLLFWTPRGAVQARRFYDREGWASTGRAIMIPDSACQQSSTVATYLNPAQDEPPPARVARHGDIGDDPHDPRWPDISGAKRAADAVGTCPQSFRIPSLVEA